MDADFVDEEWLRIVRRMPSDPIDDDPPPEPPDDGPESYAPWDPEASGPGDEEDAWLAQLPPEVREQYYAGPWTGQGEVMAAGFLHRDQSHRRGTGFAAGGVLDQLPPGPVLAQFLRNAATDHLRMTGLGESELIGVLCAARRMASWAAAQEVEAVVTLARRRAAQSRKLKNKHLLEHADGEIAAALTMTRRSASRLLDVSGHLERLPGVRAALMTGIIDWARALVFADELANLPDRDARKAAAQVLPGAGGMTTTELARALRRLVELINPDAARTRRKKGRKDAAVQLWTEPSGNCALAGRELDPAQARAADARLTAKALWLRDHGRPGTLDQLREAAFVANLNDIPLADLLPVTSPDDNQAGSSGGADPDAPGPAPGDSGPVPDGPAGPQVSGTINLTMPLSAYLGLTDRPGEVAGSGPADADTCRILATWMASDPATRWCLTLTGPDDRAVGHACSSGAPPSPSGPRDPSGPSGPPGTASGTIGRVVQWLGALRVEYLEQVDCSHERESPRYRPPRRLRHLIKIRQPSCAEPGCRRPAYRSDLDHTIPYDQGGRTCECNIGPLCRRGHRAKQAPGWHLEQPEPGVMVWTLPSGRTYTTRPDRYPV